MRYVMEFLIRTDAHQYRIYGLFVLLGFAMHNSSLTHGSMKLAKLHVSKFRMRSVTFTALSREIFTSVAGELRAIVCAVLVSPPEPMCGLFKAQRCKYSPVFYVCFTRRVYSEARHLDKSSTIILRRA